MEHSMRCKLHVSLQMLHRLQANRGLHQGRAHHRRKNTGRPTPHVILIVTAQWAVSIRHPFFHSPLLTSGFALAAQIRSLCSTGATHCLAHRSLQVHSTVMPTGIAHHTHRCWRWAAPWWHEPELGDGEGAQVPEICVGVAFVAGHHVLPIALAHLGWRAAGGSRKGGWRTKVLLMHDGWRMRGSRRD